MDDFEDLYREIILDHYRSPRNRGLLESPPAHKIEGFNPLCGDEVVVSIAVTGGVLTDIKIDGHGCSISQSSASMMSAAVKGKPLGEIRDLIRSFKSMLSIDSDSDVEPEPINPRAFGELAALGGVVKFPARIKCATLSWNTLSQGLDEVEKGE